MAELSDESRYNEMLESVPEEINQEQRPFYLIEKAIREIDQKTFNFLVCRLSREYKYSHEHTYESIIISAFKHNRVQMLFDLLGSSSESNIKTTIARHLARHLIKMNDLKYFQRMIHSFPEYYIEDREISNYIVSEVFHFCNYEMYLFLLDKCKDVVVGTGYNPPIQSMAYRVADSEVSLMHEDSRNRIFEKYAEDKKKILLHFLKFHQCEEKSVYASLVDPILPDEINSQLIEFVKDDFIFHEIALYRLKMQF